MTSDRDRDQPTRNGQKRQPSEREKRLAAALRSNLRRRKDQARQRDRETGQDESGQDETGQDEGAE